MKIWAYLSEIVKFKVVHQCVDNEMNSLCCIIHWYMTIHAALNYPIYWSYVEPTTEAFCLFSYHSFHQSLYKIFRTSHGHNNGKYI